MLLKGEKLSDLLALADSDVGALRIIPRPDLDSIRKEATASIDLRLGRWFMVLREAKTPYLDVTKKASGGENENTLTKHYFVPFGESFMLHPRKFVLGTTLEWIRLPPSLGGYVTGKSSWGRKGLIIETAAGIHPGFTGCLTLELANVGEVPIAIVPGMPICQIFLHATSDDKAAKPSQFFGRRRPAMGRIEMDPVVEKLQRPI